MRNLPLRAADAAKRTAALIEGTVTEVKDGSSIAERVAEAFTRVYAAITRAKELVAEITAASGEHSQGADEIGKAADEMSGVTQAVAASAQESAVASLELTVQSQGVRTVVDSLVFLVAGQHGALTVSGETQGSASVPLTGLSLQKQHTSQAGKAKVSPFGRPASGGAAPEQVIPLEGREFDGF